MQCNAMSADADDSDDADADCILSLFLDKKKELINDVKVIDVHGVNDGEKVEYIAANVDYDDDRRSGSSGEILRYSIEEVRAIREGMIRRGEFGRPAIAVATTAAASAAASILVSTSSSAGTGTSTVPTDMTCNQQQMPLQSLPKKKYYPQLTSEARKVILEVVTLPPDGDGCRTLGKVGLGIGTGMDITVEGTRKSHNGLELGHKFRLFPDASIINPSLIKCYSMTVGRSKESNICIPDLLTSKNHAVISFYEGYGFFVKDAGSRHGTFVDGLELTRPTAASTPTVTAGNSHLNGPVANENSLLVNPVSDIRVKRHKRQPEEELEEGEIVEEVEENWELGSGSVLQGDSRVSNIINADNEMQSDNGNSLLGSDQSDQFKPLLDIKKMQNARNLLGNIENNLSCQGYSNKNSDSSSSSSNSNIIGSGSNKSNSSSGSSSVEKADYCYLYDGAILTIGRIQLKFSLERQSAVLSKSFESSTTSTLVNSSKGNDDASSSYSISNGSEVKRHQMIISGAYSQEVLSIQRLYSNAARSRSVPESTQNPPPSSLRRTEDEVAPFSDSNSTNCIQKRKRDAHESFVAGSLNSNKTAVHYNNKYNSNSSNSISSGSSSSNGSGSRGDSLFAKPGSLGWRMLQKHGLKESATDEEEDEEATRNVPPKGNESTIDRSMQHRGIGYVASTGTSTGNATYLNTNTAIHPDPNSSMLERRLYAANILYDPLSKG